MNVQAEYVEYVIVSDIKRDEDNEVYYRYISIGEDENGSHEIKVSSKCKEDLILNKVVGYKQVPIEKEK